MLETGTILLDRFLIEERIGLGGMGAVYMATDQKFGSRVAIKETFYENTELEQAFEREARLLNSLHHPVLPHVSDYFSEDGKSFLVMEYIDGEDLSEILKRGETIPIDDVIRWTFELLDALDYLHSQEPPIVHRDIKPNNLKLTSRGNIVLLDFGLAKETSGNTLGMRSVFGYSRRYSPLEQIEGTGTDTRSDIFSLGATVFHLLTGKPPVDVLARASAIVAGRPDPIQVANDLNENIPSAFANIINTALSLNADRRFFSAGAMRNALEAAMEMESAVGESASGVVPVVDVDADVEGRSESSPESTDEITPQSLPHQKQASRGLSGAAFVKSLLARPAAWIAALFICASVLGYGIYRSGSHAESSADAHQPQTDQANNNQAERISNPAPSNVLESNDTLAEERVNSGQDAEQEPVEGPETVEVPRPEEEPGGASTSDRKTVASAKKRPETQRAASNAAPTLEPARTLPKRPRVVVTDGSRNRPVTDRQQTSASSIESIFTGIPEGRREELRQRRWERMQQEYRRRRSYPPY